MFSNASEPRFSFSQLMKEIFPSFFGVVAGGSTGSLIEGFFEKKWAIFFLSSVITALVTAMLSKGCSLLLDRSPPEESQIKYLTFK